MPAKSRARKIRRRRYLGPINEWHKDREAVSNPQRFADEMQKLMQEHGINLITDDGTGWRPGGREDLVKLSEKTGKKLDQRERERAMQKRRAYPIGTKRVLLSPQAALRVMWTKLKRKLKQGK